MADDLSTTRTLAFRFTLEPFGPGEAAPVSLAEVRRWIEDKLRGHAQLGVPLVPFNVGRDEPGPDRRGSPWLRQDRGGRLLGLLEWNGTAQAWVAAGVPGELRTVVRTEEDLEDDREGKGLVGHWAVADGTGGTPDLTGESAFFAGSAPDWDRYTVIRTGS